MFQVSFTLVTDSYQECRKQKTAKFCYMLLMFVCHAADIHGKLKEIHCELSQKKKDRKVGKDF